MQNRYMRRLAKMMAKEHRSMSFRQIAIFHKFTTPSGKPNKGMIKRIVKDGYQPKRADTLRRCPIPDFPPIIHDEPARRVLTGAWRLLGDWVSPEEYFRWNNC